MDFLNKYGPLATHLLLAYGVHFFFFFFTKIADTVHLG